MIRIFVLCSGQDDNLGDVVLRRSLLDTLRPIGELHIYLSGASPEFISGLDLGGHDRIYTELSAWRRNAYRSALRRKTWIVDKPGELQVNGRVLRSQVRLVPLLLLTKVRGGRSYRLGIGQRDSNPSLARSFRTLYRLADLVTWRDTESLADFQIGRLAPDWGFEKVLVRAEKVITRRDLIVLSYRSDRPMLGSNAIDAIRRSADAQDLSIMVICQVKRDAPRSQELARAVGGELIDWVEGVSYQEQESSLRSAYQRAALVISDRLHVLIVATAEGAIPLCITTYPEEKIQRHFNAISFPSVALDVSQHTSARIEKILERQLGRRADILRSRRLAVKAIAEIKELLARQAT